MKATRVKKTVLIFSALVLLFFACKKTEKTSPVCDGTASTYNSNIKTIINGNCTSSDCHARNSPNGDFTTYNGLKPVLNNGKFKTQVLDNQSMPKGAAKLSADQLNKIMCWHESNYPEN